MNTRVATRKRHKKSTKWGIHMRHLKKKNLVLSLLSILLTLMMMAPQSAAALTLLEAEDIEPLYSDLTTEELIKALPESASLDDPNLMLINRENRIEADLHMEFAATASGHYYDAAIRDDFNALITAAEEVGYHYQTISAYRTMAYQAANFDGRYYGYINEGYSEADAFYMTDMFVAPSDATEHSTGLAFDLLGYDYNEYGRDLHQVYGQYGSAIWLAENSQDYGFVLRYMQGKTHITGYEYEPWHFRFVGVEHAQFMHEYGLSLEEYLSLINLREEQADR